MRKGVCVQIGLGFHPEYVYFVSSNWRLAHDNQPPIHQVDSSVFEGIKDEKWEFYGIDCDPYSIAHVSKDNRQDGHWILAYISPETGGFEEVVSLCFREKARDSMFVPKISLPDIINQFDIPHIDLLAVDIEGAEVDMFESYDWRICPKYIAVEIHSYQPLEVTRGRVVNCLERAGYTLQSETPTNQCNPFPTLEAKFMRTSTDDG